MISPLLECDEILPILTVPDTKILYCPFSYRDIALELDAFIEKTFDAQNRILSEPVNTQDTYTRAFTYFTPKIQALVQDVRYPGFQKIFTMVRTDGIVIADIVGPTVNGTGGDLNAVMVQTQSYPTVLTNIKTIRYDAPTDPDVPTTIDNARWFPNLKVYSTPLDAPVDIFEPFTTRLEFQQAGSQPYGYTSRPGIYVTGQLYCVAKLLSFSSGVQVFQRLSYLRSPPSV